MARKPKGTPSDTIMTLRLPNDLQARLKTANPNGNVSEEIRLRLETSFAGNRDQKTQQLLAAVADIVDAAAEFFGVPWHENPWAWQAVATAVNERLKWNKPAGEPTPPTMADPKNRNLFGDDPEAAGRMLMGMALFKAE